jgi:hypothetical protein
MPPPRKLVLDAKNQSFFECGASLLALLAFPSSNDADRAEIAASLCSTHLRAKFKEAGNPEELVKAKYAFRDEGTIRKHLKNLDRLVRDRMVAAHVAIAFLQKAVGHSPNLPSDVKRISLNQLSEFAMGLANQSNPENFKTRVWRPSRPVLHLAAAVAVATSDRERIGQTETRYGNLFADQDFVAEVLTNTIEYELLIKNNKLPIKGDKLVSIQLVH